MSNQVSRAHAEFLMKDEADLFCIVQSLINVLLQLETDCVSQCFNFFSTRNLLTSDFIFNI